MSQSKWALALRLVVLPLLLAASLPAQKEVCVYVSLDAEHSRGILDRFEKETGIKVKMVADTEDNKTVGLVNRLIARQDAPEADVYWNNECGQTVRLKDLGLLQPYVSPSAATIPDGFKDPEGYWTGFAARARVLIYNPSLVSEDELPRTMEDLARPEHAARLLMAKPLTGTTLTHVCALYATWGVEKTDAWLDELIANGVGWERGNAQVMREVGAGKRPFGLTDTDDAYVSVSQMGRDTKTIFLDQEEGGLGNLVIPNSVMLIAGAPHPEEGKALIDWLLRKETEALLAQGTSAQMPLHPGVEAPDHVVPIEKIHTMSVDFGAVGEMISKHFEKLSDRFDTVASGGRSGETGQGAGGTLYWALGGLLLAVIFAALALRKRS